VVVVDVRRGGVDLVDVEDHFLTVFVQFVQEFVHVVEGLWLDYNFVVLHFNFDRSCFVENVNVSLDLVFERTHILEILI